MKGIIYADMSKCNPADALTRDIGKSSWHLVDYETETGLKGTMVFADPELGAPQIELQLNVSGLYKVYLGINYTKSKYGLANDLPWSKCGNLEVKLTDDLGFTRIAAEEDPKYPGPEKLGRGKLIARSIQEAYWKTAELEGQSLIIRLPCDPYNDEGLKEMANLSYVKLIPLESRDEAEWQKLQPDDDTRKGAFIFCSGSLSGSIDGGPDFHPVDIEWFRNEITPCVHTDIGIFVMEAIRGSYCTYKTGIGDVGGEDNRWHDEWIDPLAAFTMLAHENNMKLFAGMRMIGAQYPMNRHPISWASFFWKHQEWVKRDRKGTPTTSLSLAYLEVCDYWLSLLRETLDYGVDGIAVYLHRFNPFVLYEEPVVESFRTKYSEDPRLLPEQDPRWLKHCAGYVTSFLRQVRELLDEKPGRKMAVTFFGTKTKLDPDTSWEPIKYNYDVDTWISERLVDYLLPMQAPDPSLIKKWFDLSGGSVNIWPDLHPRHMPGEEFAKMAKEYYKAGANGFCLNDAERRTPHISEWAVQCRLGHRDMLDLLAREAAEYYNRVPIKTLMGFATRYSFNNFGDQDVEYVKK